MWLHAKRNNADRVASHYLQKVWQCNVQISMTCNTWITVFIHITDKNRQTQLNKAVAMAMDTFRMWMAWIKKSIASFDQNVILFRRMCLPLLVSVWQYQCIGRVLFGYIIYFTNRNIMWYEIVFHFEFDSFECMYSGSLVQPAQLSQQKAVCSWVDNVCSLDLWKIWTSSQLKGKTQQKKICLE